MILLQNSSLFSSPYTGSILLICIILTVKIHKHETSVLNSLFCFVVVVVVVVVCFLRSFLFISDRLG